MYTECLRCANSLGPLWNGFIHFQGQIPVGVPSPCSERSARGSVSNENNILLDIDILTDYPTQALLLTVLVRQEFIVSPWPLTYGLPV